MHIRPDEAKSEAGDEDGEHQGQEREDVGHPDCNAVGNSSVLNRKLLCELDADKAGDAELKVGFKTEADPSARHNRP